MKSLYSMWLLCVCMVSTLLPMPLAYLAGGSDLLVSFDTSIHTIVKTMNIGTARAVFMPGLAITPDGKKLYVADYASSTLVIIDLLTNTIQKTISLNTQPMVIAITPDGKYAYIAAAHATVYRVNCATQTIDVTLTQVHAAGEGIAITADSATVYVCNETLNQIMSIDVARGTVSAPIIVDGTTFDAPSSLAITRDGATVYVVCKGSANVLPLDAATGIQGAPILVGQNPIFIAITPDQSIAYVVNNTDSSLTPIRLSDNMPQPVIHVPGLPVSLAITADGTTAYVVSADHDSVVPIALATGSVGSEIIVGNIPVNIVIAPITVQGLLRENIFLNRTEVVLTLASNPFAQTDSMRYEIYNNTMLVGTSTAAQSVEFPLSTPLTMPLNLTIKAYTPDGSTIVAGVTID